MPSTHGTTVPNVFRSEYTLLDITDEDYLSLMDEGGETREDLKMPERPEELVKSIRAGFDAGDSLILAVVKAMGEEHAMACKKARPKWAVPPGAARVDRCGGAWHPYLFSLRLLRRRRRHGGPSPPSTRVIGRGRSFYDLREL